MRSHYGIFYMPLTGRATTAFDRFPQTQDFMVRSDGINAAVIVSKTPPVIPNEEGKNLAHEYRDPSAPSGYFQQWNFDLEHQMAGGILLQGTYLASVAKHIPKGVAYNQIPIDAVRAAGKGTQDMRPYPSFSNIGGQDERGSSNYQALQLSAERRFANGLQFMVAYTFSKMIDDVEDVFGAVAPVDACNLSLEKSLSWAHLPHGFTGSGVYELPFGRGKRIAGGNLWSKLVGNWQLGWILELQSGNQVTITQSGNTARAFTSGSRPNLVSNPVLPQDQRRLDRWFNTSAFEAAAPMTIGNSAPFPNIQGPGLASVDLSLARAIRLHLTEPSRLEVRGECFNCFNRVNFNEPNGSFGTTSFGRVTSAEGARALQVALKLWF